MSPWLDLLLVAVAVLGAVVYLLYHTWRKRGGRACGDYSAGNNPNRIQIKIPKKR